MKVKLKGRHKTAQSSRQVELDLARLLAEASDDWHAASIEGLAQAAAGEAVASPGSAAFRRRCQEAAQTAYRLTLMAKAREQIGFQPVPFEQYVELLARSAAVDVAPVLVWAGTDDLSRTTTATVMAFVRLARQLGLELRQTLLHVRLSLAAERIALPRPGLARGRRVEHVGHSDPLRDCEDLLARVERDLNVADRQHLNLLVAQVQMAYDTHGEP